MQSASQTQSLDEVDDETLQTLLMHLGGIQPTTLDSAGLSGGQGGEALHKFNSSAAAAAAAGAAANAHPFTADALRDLRGGSVQLSGSNTAANTAHGSPRPSAIGGPTNAGGDGISISDSAGAMGVVGAVHPQVSHLPDYALPDAQYVERTILPLLLRGLEEVAAARPPDPLAFLGAYLISNNPQKPTASSVMVVPGTSSNGAVTPTNQQQLQQSPFLPTEQPAVAEAVQRAVERMTPYSRNATT